MITLKKSFELQNYLTNLLSKALGVLSYTENITTTKQNHLRKKSYAEAENEEVILKKEDLPYDINTLIKFIDVLLDEMSKLTDAINNAKNSGNKNFDSMIAMNNKRRSVLRRFEMMAQLKSKESIVSGTAEKFNADGEQVTYRYDIEQVTTIDYDRNYIKKKVSQLRKELEEASNALDLMQLNCMVDYSPIFEIGETLEDVIENYKG